MPTAPTRSSRATGTRSRSARECHECLAARPANAKVDNKSEDNKIVFIGASGCGWQKTRRAPAKYGTLSCRPPNWSTPSRLSVAIERIALALASRGQTAAAPALEPVSSSTSSPVSASSTASNPMLGSSRSRGSRSARSRDHVVTSPHASQRFAQRSARRFGFARLLKVGDDEEQRVPFVHARQVIERQRNVRAGAVSACTRAPRG